MEKYGKQFKDMNLWEKIKHIWEYYRWHIVATILTVVVTVNLGITMLRPQEVDSVDVMIVGRTAYSDGYEETVDMFKEQFDAGLEIVSVDWEQGGEMEMVMLQKIPLMMMTNELDVLALAPSRFELYIQQTGPDMFVQLDTIPQLEEVLEENKDRLLTSKYTFNEEGDIIEGDVEHVYGIYVDKFKNVPCIRASEQMVVGITGKPKDVQKAAEMLAYLIEE